MTAHAFQSGDPIPPDAIPEALRARVGTEAPEKGRSLIARAMLPMPSDELGVALGILARDPDAEIAAAASASLRDVPRPVVEGIVTNELPGPVLDVYAHIFAADQQILQHLITNHAVLDETVRWMAATRRGAALEAIAFNQIRLVREPRIIEALIANPAAPTPVLARVVETALRTDIDTSHIPGFRLLADAFFADMEASEVDGENEAEAADEAADEDEDAAASRPRGSGAGIDDADMETLLTGHASEGGASDTPNKPLWKVVGDMSLPQKVRLALMGDVNARSILIRDAKKMVALSVLKSTRLSDKEVAAYAQNRAIDGEIIRQISRNREWTRHYTIMHNLVLNPKTPAQKAVTFLQSLRRRDLQRISRAKDIPAHISRSAKALLEKRRM